jgi:hypothetical protein
VQSARASALHYYLSAIVSALAAVAAWFWLPSPFLIGFAGAGALVLGATGFWHERAGREKFCKEPLTEATKKR